MDRNLMSQSVVNSMTSMPQFPSRNIVSSGIQYESNKEATTVDNVYFNSGISTYTNLFPYETLNSNLSNVSVYNFDPSNSVQLDSFPQEYLFCSQNPIIPNSAELINDHKTFNDSCAMIQETKLNVKSYSVVQSPRICYTEDYKDSFADIFSLESPTRISVVPNYTDMGFMQIDQQQQAFMCNYNQLDNMSYISPQASPNYLSLTSRINPSSDNLSLYNCSFQDFVSNDEMYQPFCNDQDILNETYSKGNCISYDHLTLSDHTLPEIPSEPTFLDYFPKIQNVFSLSNFDSVENLLPPESFGIKVKGSDATSINKISPSTSECYENIKPVKCNFEINTCSTVVKTKDEFTKSADIQISNSIEKENKDIVCSSKILKFSDEQKSDRITIMIIKPAESSLPKAVNKTAIAEKKSDFINCTRSTPNSANVNLSNTCQILTAPKQNKIKRPEHPLVSNIQSSKRKTKRASKTKRKLKERKLSYKSDDEDITTGISLKESKCRICNDSFSIQRSSKKHFRVALEKMAEVCSACNICFLQKANLALIQNKKQFRCSYCYKRFSKKSDYQSHVDDHTTEKPFKCKECDQGFSEEEKFILHSKIHKEIPPLLCSVCNKKFVKKSHLNKHFRVHTGELPKTSDKSHENPFEIPNIQERNSKPFLNCIVCDKSFAEKSVLDQHLQEHAKLNKTR